jgi:opacity protein-like surface antigen
MIKPFSNRLLACAAVFVLCSFTIASAETDTVRVVTNGARIWHADFVRVAATARAGTVLEVIRTLGKWYEVVIPEREGGKPGERGYIYFGHVEPASASQRTDKDGTDRVPDPAAVAPATKGEPAAARPRRGRERRTTVRGFGQLGYLSLAARQSFEAVFGDSYVVLPGGGVQVVSPEGVFLQIGVERYVKHGQRVFVADGTVYPLGIPASLTVVPVMFEAGYRAPVRGRVVPYGGGGAGFHYVKETSAFADEEDDPKERFLALSALGGVEIRTSRWIRTAIEVQYTSVTKEGGPGGAAAAYGEKNLGGLNVRFRLVVGR